MSERVIGRLSQIPRGEGRNFEVDGTRIAVFRTWTDELFATEPDCPHRQGPLADGLIGNGRVVCPLHDRSYDLQTGEEIGGECRLRTYGVRAGEDGAILLDLASLPKQEAVAAA
ncbi:MAG: Rieske (2Fe-2S) protein [Geminicoccaceae bacterium]